MNVQTLLKFYNCRSELHLLFYAFYYSNTNVYGFIQLYRGDLCLYILLFVSFVYFCCHFNQRLEKSLSRSTIDQFSVALSNNSITCIYWGFLEYLISLLLLYFSGEHYELTEEEIPENQ